MAKRLTDRSMTIPKDTLRGLWDFMFSPVFGDDREPGDVPDEDYLLYLKEFVNVFLDLYRDTYFCNRIQDNLTDGEILFFRDWYNKSPKSVLRLASGTLFKSEFQTYALGLNPAMAELMQKHGVDGQALNAKIKFMSAMEILTIFLWIRQLKSEPGGKTFVKAFRHND